ncbi:21934_t:CDS:2 [Entrophospora sp. SA101]|nr:21934_t:CDS:2 [Entrophospora sp. SA101]
MSTTHIKLSELKEQAKVLNEPNEYKLKVWVKATEKLIEEACPFSSNFKELIENANDLVLYKTYHELKKKLPNIMTETERTSLLIQKNQDQLDKDESEHSINKMPEPFTSFNSSNSNLNFNQVFDSSPVYIVGNKMIGNLTSSTQSPNAITMTPVDAYKNKIEKTKADLKNDDSFCNNNNININNEGNFDTYVKESSRNSILYKFSITPNSETINASELNELLIEPDTAQKILLFDVRHREDFDQSHIKTKNIVCLDPLIIKDGVSSLDMESKLIISPKKEQDLFKNRNLFELVILYDQDSVSKTPKLAQTNTLNNLINIIYENEYMKKLKRSPLLLNGGFASWKRLYSETGTESTSSEDGNISNQVDEYGYDLGPINNLSTTRARTNNHDKSKRNAIIIPNDSLPLLDTLSRQSTLHNEQSYARNITDYVSIIIVIYKQSMTGTGHDQIAYNSNYLDYSQTNSTKMPSRYQSPESLPRNPQKELSDTQRATDLKRRKTIFDHPYNGFTNVQNSDYLPTRSQKKQNTAVNTTMSPPPLPNKVLLQVGGNPTSPPPPSSPSYKTSLIVPNEQPMEILNRPSSGLGHYHQRFPTSESSFSQLSSGIGIAGLKNLGNTCFMNSIIQCLSGTIPFARYFLNGSYKNHINKVNPLGTKGALAIAFANLIKVVWSGQYPVVSPVTFKQAIGDFAPQFSGTDQQDSQEFLAYLLDGLHEDLNIVKVKPIIKELTEKEEEIMEGLPIQIASVFEWDRYMMRNSSIVVSLFQGQFRNQLKCLSCGKTSTTYNTFMYLSLPIPKSKSGNKNVNLLECLDAFIKEEVLEGEDAWKCPKCKIHQRATKRLSISRLPDVLLIHLKRFSFKGPFRDKMETLIDFPLKNLDLTRYVPSPLPQSVNNSGKKVLLNSTDSDALIDSLQQVGPFVYNLYAVSNHYGGLNGGHYTACVRNSFKNEWHNFDDSRVSVCKEESVKSRAAYNLFYVRNSL